MREEEPKQGKGTDGRSNRVRGRRDDLRAWLQAEEQGVVATVDGWCDVTAKPVGAEVKLVGTGEKREAEKEGPREG